MKNKITIAAVIPLYNGQDFIRESLESVINQDMPADEIIVVDDGSTDRGRTIVEEIIAANPSAPIILLRKENGGQSSARNHAAAHTKCTHIAYLDQDDVWYPEHLAILAEPFLKGETRVGLVYGNLNRIDRDGRMVMHEFLNSIHSPQPKKSLYDCLKTDLFILPGACLVPKYVLDQTGGFDERLCGYEDDDLFTRIFSLGYNLIYINTPVTKWRIYSGSTSYSPRMAKSRMIYFKKLLDSYPDDQRLNVYWSSNLITPRFFSSVSTEFMQGAATQDSARVKQALSDIQIVLPFLSKKRRRKLSLALPAITLGLQCGLFTIPREIFKWARRQ